jgi:recombination protein RecT
MSIENPNSNELALAVAERAEAGRNAVQRSAPRSDPKNALKHEVQKYTGEISRALPTGYTGGAERFARTVLTAVATDKTGNLAKCSPRSICGAALQAAQLGLSVGVMGEAWLVPYNGEATFQLGYKGLISLAARSGITITAHTVHANDEFDYELGLSPVLRHRPARANRGPSELWYAVARDRNTGQLLNFAVIDRDQVEKRRRANRGKSPAWDWFDEMAMTKAVRELCRFLPLSVEMATALASDGIVRNELDGDAETYATATDDDVIDGEVID